MGSLSLPISGDVYVDSQILIYAVEKFPRYQSILRPMWEAFVSGKIKLITSELAILETLVVPMRIKNQRLLEDCERVLFQSNLKLMPVTQSVLRKAAILRAEIPRLKSPDAIHAATAVVQQSSLFVTNDSAFRAIPNLSAVILNDLIEEHP